MTETPDPDAAAREAMRLIGPDPQNWVPDRPGLDHNVVVVGGGQSGCAFAFALRRAGIGKASVIDMADDEARAGVWLNAARMNVLRTPKTLAGPELGIPALSFQAWYEARNSRAAYDAFERIPREAWAEYLAWYRRFLDIPVRYRTCLVRIEPAAGHFRLHIEEEGRLTVETARKVILANGVAGNGGPYIPSVLHGALPRRLYAHTADRIEFAALSGRRVAVIGGAASAFDAAGVALETGAASVHLFARRASLAAIPISRVRGYPGVYDNYGELPTRCAGTRRSASAAPARPRRPTRSSECCAFATSTCTWPQLGSGRAPKRTLSLPMPRVRNSSSTSRSPAPGISSTRRPAPSSAISRTRSYCGATATLRSRAMRTRTSLRIPISAPGTNTSRKRREAHPIYATSTSTTPRVLSALAGPRATYRACGVACRRSSLRSAAICCWPISICTATASWPMSRPILARCSMPLQYGRAREDAAAIARTDRALSRQALGVTDYFACLLNSRLRHEDAIKGDRATGSKQCWAEVGSAFFSPYSGVILTFVPAKLGYAYPGACPVCRDRSGRAQNPDHHWTRGRCA
jgi:thioredoxin reductase